MKLMSFLLLAFFFAGISNQLLAQESVKTIKVNKSMSKEDSKEVLQLLRSMDQSSFKVSIKDTKGNFAAYGSVRPGQISTGSQRATVVNVPSKAWVHSTLTDFFGKTALKSDRVKLAKIQAIVQKYQ